MSSKDYFAFRSFEMKTSFNPGNLYARFCFGIVIAFAIAGCGGSSSAPASQSTLTSITITPAPIFIEINAKPILKATGNYSNGATADLSSNVAWTSADPAIASISSLGVVTGVALGSTPITATLDGVSSTVTITVVDGPSNSLHMARFDHTATLLNDGSVLVTGGYGAAGTALDSAELYDSSQGTWTVNFLGLATGRGDHTATLLVNSGCLALSNCKVLVAGGIDFSNKDAATAELYDPSTKTWTKTGDPITPRSYHTSTLLPDGRVMMVGGTNQSIGQIANAEIYDSATGQWSATASLATKRDSHTATLLAHGPASSNGKVLVVGGFYNDALGGPAIATGVELYDPVAGTWTSTGSLGVGRYLHTATLLNDGTVLVVGGIDQANNVLASAELYDPISGTWTSAGVGSLATARYNHTATLIASGPNLGKVLVVGGSDATTPSLPSAELYDPATKTWSQFGVAARVTHTATQLSTGPNSGKVLVVGGDGVAGALSSVELLN